MGRKRTTFKTLPEFGISDFFEKVMCNTFDDFLKEFEFIKDFCTNIYYFDYRDECDMCYEGIDVEVNLIIPPVKKAIVNFNIGKDSSDDNINIIKNNLHELKKSEFIKTNRDRLEIEIREYFKGCLKKSFTNDFVICCYDDETSLTKILNGNKISNKNFKFPKFNFIINDEMIKTYEQSHVSSDKFLSIPNGGLLPPLSYIKYLCTTCDDIISLSVGKISPINSAKLGSIYHIDCIDILHNDITENRTCVTHLIINGWITRDYIRNIVMDSEIQCLIDNNIKKFVFSISDTLKEIYVYNTPQIMDIIKDHEISPSDKIKYIKSDKVILNGINHKILNNHYIKDILFSRSTDCNWILAIDTAYVIATIPCSVESRYIELFMQMNQQPPKIVFDQFSQHEKIYNCIFPKKFWKFKSYEVIDCGNHIMIKYEYRLDITEYTIGPIYPSKGLV